MQNIINSSHSTTSPLLLQTIHGSSGVQNAQKLLPLAGWLVAGPWLGNIQPSFHPTRESGSVNFFHFTSETITTIYPGLRTGYWFRLLYPGKLNRGETESFSSLATRNNSAIIRVFVILLHIHCSLSLESSGWRYCLEHN